MSDIYAMGILEQKERENGAKAVFGKVISVDFPKLIKHFNVG